MNKRRLTTALLLAAAALPSAASAYPSTNPAQTWPGNLAVKGDQTVPLSFFNREFRSTGSGNQAQIHTGHGQWIISRGKVDGHDHRNVVNAGPVNVYSVTAHAYLVRRVASSGPVVRFSTTPSPQWELSRLPGEARMRLYNSLQQDYLVQGFPGIDDVSLNWQSKLEALTRTTAQRVTVTRHILPADGTYFEGRMASVDGVINQLTNASGFAVRVLPLGAPGEDCLDPSKGVALAANATATQDQLRTLLLRWTPAKAPVTLRACGPYQAERFFLTLGTQNTTPE